MTQTRYLFTLLALFATACHGADEPAPQRVLDPNVPPRTPTITTEVPGFDAPASTGRPAPAAASAPTAPAAPVAPPSPLAARLGHGEVLHYIEGVVPAGAQHGGTIDIHGIFVRPAPPNAPPESNGEEFFAVPLLQNARIVDRKPGVRDQLGLALTTDEVEVLLATTSEADLALLLRPREDVSIDSVTQLTLRELLEDLEVIQEKRQIRRRRAGAVIGSASIGPDERGLELPHGLPAGVLTPGTQVDVYGTFTTAEGGGVVTMTLLQDIDVVRADTDNVQLSVTAEEAMLLLLACRRGELAFVLRGLGRDVSTIAKKTTQEVLQDLEVIQEKRQIRIRRKQMPRRPGDMIEIIAGDGGGGGGISRAPRVRAPETESYRNPGQNAWVTTADDALSTFAADVDTGSFTIARRKLAEGVLPPTDSVRPEEWVNYFSYHYPPPTTGPFGVSVEAAPSPFQTDANYRLLRVGVQGRSYLPAQRPSVHLTFLVDVSGSMSGPDRLDLAKRALRYLVERLEPDDTVAIATYAGGSETVLAPTRVAARDEVLRAIDTLQAGGSTAMNDGLKTAYALADSTFIPNGENRVIVLSDGDANVGRTGVDDMLATIAAGAKRGITLSTIGFGMGNYKDAAMEQLANKGNGSYYYVDKMEEVERLFGTHLDATLFTIAREVKLQVEFDPAAVKRYRLIGYENRDIADRDFRNESVDAGEVGAGHAVTALYELEMADPAAPTVATVRIRHREPHGDGPTLETTAVFRGIDLASRLADTSYSFRFAAAVAAFAEITRQSPYATHLNLDWVEEIAVGAVQGDPQRRELLTLIRAARTVAGG